MKAIKMAALLLLVGVLLSCNLFMAPRKAADTLRASVDGFVEDTSIRNFAGEYITVSTGAPISRGLIVFDGVPDNTTVYNAELRLYSQSAMQWAASVARVTQGWDQATVTWSQVIGAGFATSDGSSTETVPMSGSTVVFNVTTIVQAWADGESNNGFILSPVGSGGGFAANEETMMGYPKPELWVAYAE